MEIKKVFKIVELNEISVVTSVSFFGELSTEEESVIVHQHVMNCNTRAEAIATIEGLLTDKERKQPEHGFDIQEAFVRK